MYHMTDSETSEKVVRVKSTSRDVHGFLSTSDFGQDMSRPLYANRYRLAPTRGHEMTISLESKRLICAFNAKRRCEVSRSCVTAAGRSVAILLCFNLSSVSQDEVHSFPL